MFTSTPTNTRIHIMYMKLWRSLLVRIKRPLNPTISFLFFQSTFRPRCQIHRETRWRMFIIQLFWVNFTVLEPLIPSEKSASDPQPHWNPSSSPKLIRSLFSLRPHLTFASFPLMKGFLTIHMCESVFHETDLKCTIHFPKTQVLVAKLTLTRLICTEHTCITFIWPSL